MHKHTDRYDPYHHSKWAQYRNPQVQDTSTAFSEHSSYQDQSYTSSQVNGQYYFDPPYQAFSNAQEEAAFRTDIVRLREEEPLKVASNSQHDQRAARIFTISPSPSTTEQSSVNLIDPSRFKITENSPEKRLFEGSPEFRANPRSMLAPPRRLKREEKDMPANANLSMLPPRANPMNPKYGCPVVQPSQVFQVSSRLANPTVKNSTRSLAAMTQQEMEGILVSLKIKMKMAQAKDNRIEFACLKDERDKVSLQLQQYTEERRRQNQKKKALHSMVLTQGTKQPEQPAGPVPQSLAVSNGEAVEKSLNRPRQTLKDDTEVIADLVVHFGRLTERVANLEKSFSLGTRSGRIEGLGIALVASARELLSKTEEVTGKSSEREHDNQHLLKMQNAEAKEDAFPCYDEERNAV
ncbi:MAG: hypothetical protein Q9225_002444 [Loekoesia sp. 1 TL-2023]